MPKIGDHHEQHDAAEHHGFYRVRGHQRRHVYSPLGDPQ